MTNKAIFVIQLPSFDFSSDLAFFKKKIKGSKGLRKGFLNKSAVIVSKTDKGSDQQGHFCNTVTINTIVGAFSLLFHTTLAFSEQKVDSNKGLRKAFINRSAVIISKIGRGSDQHGHFCDTITTVTIVGAFSLLFHLTLAFSEQKVSGNKGLRKAFQTGVLSLSPKLAEVVTRTAVLESGVVVRLPSPAAVEAFSSLFRLTLAFFERDVEGGKGLGKGLR